MNIGISILNNVTKNKEVISATIVGSYTDKKDLDKIGDIDVVIICKKLNKKLIINLSKNLLKMNKKLKKKIIINSSFGPLKINSRNSLPVHLMIYDINSHIEHVCASPFTCYDWERSFLNKGLSLKEVFPVNFLQLKDFFKSRRSSKEYLNDLLKNKISVRSYTFSNNKIKLKKHYIKINSRNKGEFVYHIVNFLVLNLNKYLINKNIKINERNFKKLFLKITSQDKDLLNQFLDLKRKKEKKSTDYNGNEIQLGKKFIKKYNNFLKSLKEKQTYIDFIRHAKTNMNKKNIFLGSGSDPNIVKMRKKKSPKYDLIITSNLKRSKSTAKLFKSKKIISTPLLNEIDYGKIDGKNIEFLKLNHPKIVKSWKKGIDIKFPNGESTKNVKQRIFKFLNFLRKIRKKKKILIITHSYFLRVFLGLFLKFKINKVYKLKISHLEKFEFIKNKNLILPNLERHKMRTFCDQLND
tara:strand:+ start:3562 stop:4962 length:1401 start_codon:yes stop_codon:yes gene_type:complete